MNIYWKMDVVRWDAGVCECREKKKSHKKPTKSVEMGVASARKEKIARKTHKRR